VVAIASGATSLAIAVVMFLQFRSTRLRVVKRQQA
jgi:hypothetical protein